jgi:nucleotide-binding universal stress UspA family protein
MVPHALEKYDVIRPIIRMNRSSLRIAGFVKKEDPAGYVEMKALVDSVKTKIKEDDVICGSEEQSCDDVAKAVLDMSNKEKPDLIVITATLDKSLRDFFMGPYTQDIVNHARSPVLSIRPQISNEPIKSLNTLIGNEFQGSLLITT